MRCDMVETAVRLHVRDTVKITTGMVPYPKHKHTHTHIHVWKMKILREDGLYKLYVRCP
jgi:hypothetical protein